MKRRQFLGAAAALSTLPLTTTAEVQPMETQESPTDASENGHIDAYTASVVVEDYNNGFVTGVKANVDPMHPRVHAINLEFIVGVFNVSGSFTPKGARNLANQLHEAADRYESEREAFDA